MNILYDEEGYEYPIDEYGQIYVPLEPERTVAGENEEEIEKETKKLKRSYASVTVAGVTTCSAGVGSYKEKKIRREVAEYLQSSADKARFLRGDGSVLICNLVALKQEVENINAGRR